MRLDKYICYSSDLTLSQARTHIANQQVQVAGHLCTNPAQQVHEHNNISLAGQRLTPRPARYIMLHKRLNTLCSHQDGAYPSLFSDLDLEKAELLHLVGRLDADTTGLVLLTDDGRWSYQLTHPQSGCRKVYRVTLRSELATDTAQLFKQGILLQGEAKPTLPAILTPVTAKEVLLTITEGRFHQVKRMFAAVNNKVLALHREQVGNLQLDLAPREWRYLTSAEVMATHIPKKT
ncbi:pseudouridine synthase [Oceanisphaera avium]|uniref:Pseudouridine synthase n=1 Tax=Oceanisphaera avium TaxID=1903694 RepID=A0A1Y0CZ57_9GAMM|nr:16S rRNA pseudouridine(516) synthase [Oceanisphaera avium]ART80611.1 16S rRNA pseudouridine(516) synthase [Oceanisphaera avium]